MTSIVSTCNRSDYRLLFPHANLLHDTILSPLIALQSIPWSHYPPHLSTTAPVTSGLPPVAFRQSMVNAIKAPILLSPPMWASSPSTPSFRRPSVQDSRDSFDSLLSMGTIHTIDPAAQSQIQTNSGNEGIKNKAKFWLVFGSLCVTTFLSALDTTSFSTALPTIVSDLNGTEFLWVGISYTMASTATLPMTGGLAQTFGRKHVMLGSIALFLIGSIICGAASCLTVLIVGRAVQGVGGGAISSLSEIVISDLVPLSRRGMYTGIVSAVWAFASAIGPPVGGAFSEKSWRWLFYMNFPLAVIAFLCVWCFLDLKRPRDELGVKLRRMDWVGSFIIIGSSCIFVVALSNTPIIPWGLIPLLTGIIGFFVFFWYEARVAENPTIPWDLLTNRTSLSGYLIIFFHAIASSAVIFYMPVYFQSAKMRTPSQAGVAVFGSVFSVTPAAILCGTTISGIGLYRPPTFLGWFTCITGFALLSTLNTDSPPTQWVGFQVITGIGLGILYSSPKFPILAPLPLEKSANALALASFIRKFSGIWGITIGSTILENQLSKRLPTIFINGFHVGLGGDYAYTSIPRIPTLPEPIRTEVRVAFSGGLRMIWLALVGISVCGLLSACLMKEIPMHSDTDHRWGLEGDDPNVAPATMLTHRVACVTTSGSLQKITMSPGIQEVDVIMRPKHMTIASMSTAKIAMTPLSQSYFNLSRSDIASTYKNHRPPPSGWSDDAVVIPTFRLLDPPLRIKRGGSRSTSRSIHRPASELSMRSITELDLTTKEKPCPEAVLVHQVANLATDHNTMRTYEPAVLGSTRSMNFPRSPSPPPLTAHSFLPFSLHPGILDSEDDWWIQLNYETPMTPSTPRRPHRAPQTGNFEVQLNRPWV